MGVLLGVVNVQNALTSQRLQIRRDVLAIQRFDFQVFLSGFIEKIKAFQALCMFIQLPDTDLFDIQDVTGLTGDLAGHVEQIPFCHGLIAGQQEQRLLNFAGFFNTELFLILGQAPVGDVLCRSKHADRFAEGIEADFRLLLNNSDGLVGKDDPMFHKEGFPVFQCFLHLLLDFFTILGMHPFQKGIEMAVEFRLL